MKKASAAIFTCLLCAICMLSAPAAPIFAGERRLDRLVDDADLLTSQEETALLAKLDEISERQKCDVAIISVDALEGKTAEGYAEDFFDYNGYGYGEDDDGILFLISMENRDWAISTYGFGIRSFTDAGQEYIMRFVKPSLSSGSYNEAFTDFASYCNDFLTQARTGNPYDTGNLPPRKMTRPLTNILISLGIGAIIALFVVQIMKKSMKGVGAQTTADKYVNPEGLNLTAKTDTFLFEKVTRTAKPTSSSGSGSGSKGGSSTRSSSSGRSHGGSSGKF